MEKVLITGKNGAERLKEHEESALTELHVPR